MAVLPCRGNAGGKAVVRTRHGLQNVPDLRFLFLPVQRRDEVFGALRLQRGPPDFVSLAVDLS